MTETVTFTLNGQETTVEKGLTIWEAANGRGLADRLLRSRGERPTRRCSKYCIGMAATGRVSKYNRFLPTMRKLGLTVSEPNIGNWSALRNDLQARFDMAAMQSCIAAE